MGIIDDLSDIPVRAAGIGENVMGDIIAKKRPSTARVRQLKRIIIKEQNHTCKKCKTHISNGELYYNTRLHHVTAFSEVFGTNLKSNFIVLCKKCHSYPHGGYRWIEDFLRQFF